MSPLKGWLLGVCSPTIKLVSELVYNATSATPHQLPCHKLFYGCCGTRESGFLHHHEVFFSPRLWQVRWFWWWRSFQLICTELSCCSEGVETPHFIPLSLSLSLSLSHTHTHTHIHSFLPYLPLLYSSPFILFYFANSSTHPGLPVTLYAPFLLAYAWEWVRVCECECVCVWVRVCEWVSSRYGAPYCTQPNDHIIILQWYNRDPSKRAPL